MPKALGRLTSSHCGRKRTMLVLPNVGGNWRAALALAKDQSMCRRVRLTVGLGVMLLHRWTAASA